MKLIPMIVASLCLASTSWAQNSHAADGRKSKSMPTLNDSSMVAPALEKYAQGPLAGLWKRPGLTRRDRSIITIAIDGIGSAQPPTGPAQQPTQAERDSMLAAAGTPFCR